MSSGDKHWDVRMAEYDKPEGWSMQTVGDVIEFWKGYCDREGTLTQEEVNKGCDMIADDADFWRDQMMSKLRDRIWEETRKVA